MQRLHEPDDGANGPRVASVAGFLRRYGYLAPSQMDFTSASDAIYGTIEEGLAKYQRLHGLPETGLPDQETLRVLNTPRCGVPEIASDIELAYLAGATDSWGKRNITFTIDLNNYVPSLGPNIVKEQVSLALEAWAAAGDLTFTSQFPADLFIAFRLGDHGDGHPNLVFDGAPGGTLGHAFPPRHPRLAGQVHLDSNEDWSITLPVTGSADLPTILLHELGHALGLEHNTLDTSAVMHERFEKGTSRRTLSESDVQALLALYS